MKIVRMRTRAGKFRGPTFGLLSCLVLVSSSPAWPAGLDGEDAPPRWRLACRLASYGKHQDAAWSHLPSIGVHHVFVNGVEIACEGRLTGERAGTVLRSGRDTFTVPLPMATVA